MSSGRWFAAMGLFTASAVYSGQAPPATPLLVLATEAGEIAIELAPTAAPGAVAWIERLAHGPIYDPSLVPSPDESPCGYFDGLEFTYTRPKVEIRLESRRPAEWFRINHRSMRQHSASSASGCLTPARHGRAAVRDLARSRRR
jgi:hypothetical protein